MENVYQIALREMGTTEIKGSLHNPRIIEYHQSTTLKAAQDEVPWCAAFVSWCLEQAGIRSTRSAAARSYVSWGKEVRHFEAERGDIVVLSRGTNPVYGHVGFFVRWSENHVHILGGNQGDSVSIAPYSKNRIITIRRYKP